MRLSKARELLSDHHSAQRTPMGHGGWYAANSRFRRGRPYTLCPSGCERSWMYNHKIDETSHCKQCGSAFQSSWGSQEAAASKSEWVVEAESTKAAAIREQYTKAKAANAAGIVEILEAIHPEIVLAKKQSDVTPYRAFQEASQKHMSAKKKLEAALDKATKFQQQLQKAQEDAAKAMADTIKAENALASASEAYHRANGIVGNAPAHPCAQAMASPNVGEHIPEELKGDVEIAAKLRECQEQQAMLKALVQSKTSDRRTRPADDPEAVPNAKLRRLDGEELSEGMEIDGADAAKAKGQPTTPAQNSNDIGGSAGSSSSNVRDPVARPTVDDAAAASDQLERQEQVRVATAGAAKLLEQSP